MDNIQENLAIKRDVPELGCIKFNADGAVKLMDSEACVDRLMSYRFGNSVKDFFWLCRSSMSCDCRASIYIVWS